MLLQRPATHVPIAMKQFQASELVAYGVIVPALSYMVYHFSPTVGRNAYLIGFTGGGLCFVWGVLSLIGFRHVWPALLTLIVTAFGSLSQAVRLWMADDVAGNERRIAAVAITVVFVFSAGLVGQISHVAQGTFTARKDV